MHMRTCGGKCVNQQLICVFIIAWTSFLLYILSQAQFLNLLLHVHVSVSTPRLHFNCFSVSLYDTFYQWYGLSSNMCQRSKYRGVGNT